MRFDISGHQARLQRRSERKRLAHATLAAVLAGAVSLMFSFALGVQNASWEEAWAGVGGAYTLFGSDSGRPREG